LINFVILIGNLGNDPEVHYSQEGNPIANFNLAFHTSVKKSDEPNWIKAVCFNRLAEIAEKYLHKGARVAVAGVLDQNRWISNEGVQKSNFQILVNTLEFIKTDGRGFEEGQSSNTGVPF